MNEKSMSTRTSYLQGLTLKELLEHPDLQNALQTADDKVSFQDEQNDPLAAFLGPNLWEKTYDFNLEYMNLDDFLTESGISTDAVTQLDSSSNDDNCCSSLPIPSPGSRPPNDLLNSTASSSESLHDLPAGLDLTPEKICSKVDFNVSKLDLVLATDTGKNGKDGRPFDPQNHHFSEEELKPQPLIKKSKKIFVPDELKNEKYWLHRKKNNMVAKRSREARRLKENQIVLRAGYLEKESKILREELTRFQKEARSTWKENEQLKLENKELKTLLARYGSENSLRIVTG